MAIKSRLLSKLKSTYVSLNMVGNAHPQKLHPILLRLTEARDLCKMGLTESNYARYGEVYDGLIMAMEQVLSGEAGKDSKEVVALCKELLEHIVLETGKEANFKKEVVFLPYKYSMWDSLESVWRAAYEDKDNCIAYVIPIPYADRNPDGTAKEWHCEREFFPADIPTLDCQEVDLKAMHPEVIIIHNPYDDCNRVTSIDELFYSRNIKPCTDKLVYIPYFVLGEPKWDYDDPEKAEEVMEAEEKIAHFITTPGVLNADLTIVQSEAMKKVYVNVLTRYTNAPREYWEEHIQGLGSPKFDKVASSRKEDFKLPEERARLINGRKTILYNTGLTAMLEHTDKFVEKIRQVLATFKAQDEVVLWWRPHPLLRSTFEAMHPELLEEYDEIVRGYRQEGWGIYDDTAELERAVAWTDGYYGDGSSVVKLYEKCQKAILIQSIGHHIPEHDFGKSLYFTDGIWEGDTLYFPAWNVNGIFSFNSKTEQVKLLRFLPAKLDVRFLFCRMEKIGPKIYLIPTNEDFILIFDVKSGEWEKVYIDDGKLGDSRARFTDAYRFGNTIWLKPYFSQTIVSYSVENGKMSYYSEWYKELEPYIDEDNDTPKFGVGSKSDNAFYFPLVQANKVVEFDVCSRKHRILSVGEEEDCIVNSHYHDKKLYCYTKNDDLLIYDLEAKKVARRVDVFYKQIGAASMLVKDGVLWIFACKKDVYARVDMNTFYSEVVEDYCGGVDIGYPSPVLKDDLIYLYPNQGSYMVEVDTNSNEVKKISIVVPEEYEAEWEKQIVEQFPMREKKEIANLKKLISVKMNNNEEKTMDCAGDAIYKFAYLS